MSCEIMTIVVIEASGKIVSYPCLTLLPSCYCTIKLNCCIVCVIPMQAIRDIRKRVKNVSLISCWFLSLSLPYFISLLLLLFLAPSVVVSSSNQHVFSCHCVYVVKLLSASIPKQIITIKIASLGWNCNFPFIKAHNYVRNYPEIYEVNKPLMALYIYQNAHFFFHFSCILFFFVWFWLNLDHCLCANSKLCINLSLSQSTNKFTNLLLQADNLFT